MRSCAAAVLGAALTLASVDGAMAQSVAEFYRGKTISMLIGAFPGGEYDLKTRLVARHIGKFIPGNPALVPQNVLGAGGLKMVNFLFNQAPRDGTYIGTMPRSFPALQAVGLQSLQFDAARFNWLGTIAPVVETVAVWHTTGVRTVEDARHREVIAGANAKGSTLYTYPAMMNELLGTKFKIVTGYAGNHEINLAMERGEVEARDNSWSSWKVTQAEWLRDHKINIIVQAGPRAPDLDAPSMEDLARNAEDRALIELVVSGTRLGTPLFITPGVPEERVKALRAAFDATMKDPDFLADAANLKFDVTPIGGEAMQKIVESIISTPKPIAARAKHLVE